MKKNTNSKKHNTSTPTSRTVSRAMELWQIYGANYSTCLNSYKALLQRKRDLKIKPLGKIPECVLKEFPEMPFLKIKKPGEAEAYLRKLDDIGVRRLIHRIEYMVEYDHSYRTVSNRVKEFEYQVKNHGKKGCCGLNPECIGSGKGCKHPSSGRNRRIDDKK